MKKSQTPSNKAVSVVHVGEGVLEFQIPSPSKSHQISTSTQKEESHPSKGRLPLRANIYLFLLRLSNTIKRKKSVFYLELLREGFLQQGAITLMGFDREEASGKEKRPIFKTVLQLDGDIICQMDRSRLKRPEIQPQMAVFSAVQNQLLEGFKQSLGSIVSGALALLSGFLVAAYLIQSLMAWGGP